MTDSSPPSPTPLVLTGERTLPGIPHETYWFERHVVAYELAARRVSALAAAGRAPAVLDAGCGEGYGLEILARAGARRVVGIDVEPAVVAHVGATYARRLTAVEAIGAELGELPLADATFDLVVSFQVIEHLHDLPGCLAALARVTRPGGVLLVATPNRLTFTPGSDTPVNPFHTRELSPDELRDQLRSAGLADVRVAGVFHGARLRLVERLAGRSVPDLLAMRPPEQWPTWLSALVRRVRAGWFDVRTDRLHASLDLVAACRVPRR